MGATSRWCPVKNEPQRAPESHRKKESRREMSERVPPLAFVAAVWLTALSLAFRATTPNHTHKLGAPKCPCLLCFFSFAPFHPSFPFSHSLFSPLNLQSLPSFYSRHLFFLIGALFVALSLSSLVFSFLISFHSSLVFCLRQLLKRYSGPLQE